MKFYWSSNSKDRIGIFFFHRSQDENEEKSTLDDNENEKNGGGGGGGGGNYYDLANEDEAIAHDLDMHSLILSGLNVDSEPVKTAEEVIREINELIEVCGKS